MSMSDIISQHWAKECQQSGHSMILKCMAEGCGWGGAYFYTTHAEHLADELAKAGYGELQEAKAEALDAAVALLRDRAKWTRSDHGPYVTKTGYDDDGRGNEAADIDEWYADWLEQFPYREQEQG